MKRSSSSLSLLFASLLLCVGCRAAPLDPTALDPAPLDWVAEVRREAAESPGLYLRARLRSGGLLTAVSQDWLSGAVYDPGAQELVLDPGCRDVETSPTGVSLVPPLRLQLSDLEALEGWYPGGAEEPLRVWPSPSR